MKAEIPCEPAARSVIASTTVVSANVALVIKFFEPLSTQPPARRTAVVRIELASEPELGSVRPHAAKASPLASGARYFRSLRFISPMEDVSRAKGVVRRYRKRDRCIDPGQFFHDVA